MSTTWNTEVNPKAKTQLFKIYAQVSGTEALPTWELQGRGVTSWTVEQNQDINKEPDVLGYVDMERGIAQPAQSGVALNIRKDSVLGTLLFDAWFSGDYSKLDDISILQKFEFVDGATTGSVLARLQKHCLIAINSFSGEAGGYLGFDVDIHYSNDIITGQMTKVDASPIVFTPDSTPSEE